MELRDRYEQFSPCAPCSSGKERDTESGNDYFGKRYYASSMGHWLSPDESFDGAIMELRQTGTSIATNTTGHCTGSILMAGARRAQERSLAAASKVDSILENSFTTTVVASRRLAGAKSEQMQQVVP